MVKKFKIPSIFKSISCFNGENAKITQLRSSCPEPYEAIETRDHDMTEDVDVKALRSNRLLFEPENTRSIMERSNKVKFVALAMESEDPYEDFRISMEKIAVTCGLMEDYWKQSEELLAWYLKMNMKKNYCFIVEAFVDVFTKRHLSFFPALV